MNEIKQLNRNWILAALMLTMTLAAMDTTIVSTAIPEIVADLGGFSKFSWVFSIYLLAQTVTIPIYGKLSDLFGRKKILIFGIILFLIGSLSSGLAWNIETLIIFRGFQGLGAGSIMATVNTIAGDIYSVEERAKIQGYLSSIWGVSAILGPAIGGALTEYVHWRWIFLINLPFGAIAIFFLMRYFHEKIQVHKTKIDYKGATLIIVTLSLLFVLLLESGQSWSWISPQSISLFSTIVILSYLTYRIEDKTEHAIIPVWIWRNKTIAFTNLAIIAMGVIMMGPDTLLPTFTQAALGVGTIASGFILASMSIGWPTASALSGRLYLKIGFKNTSIIGAIIVFTSCVFFILIPKPQPIYLLVINQVMIGAGFGLLSTPSLVGIQSMVKWEQRGVVTSSNIFARNLGQSIGAAIVGAIFNNSLNQQIKNHKELTDFNTEQVLTTIKFTKENLPIKSLLRDLVNNATHHVYWGLILFSVIILIFLMLIPGKKERKKDVLNLTGNMPQQESL
ncbi:MAG TPA: MDR family MFS transporter [Edaphocola sp.]|nr:MDR family MFS transporter [Edaphocola sp.]